MRYVADSKGNLVKAGDIHLPEPDEPIVEKSRLVQTSDGRLLIKSTVKAHERKTKTGKIVNVNQYQNAKTKQAGGEKPNEEKGKQTAQSAIDANAQAKKFYLNGDHDKAYSQYCKDCKLMERTPASNEKWLEWAKKTWGESTGVVDEKIAAKLNIGRYGNRGFEVEFKDGTTKAFYSKPTERENWNDSVRAAMRAMNDIPENKPEKKDGRELYKIAEKLSKLSGMAHAQGEYMPEEWKRKVGIDPNDFVKDGYIEIRKKHCYWTDKAEKLIGLRSKNVKSNFASLGVSKSLEVEFTGEEVLAGLDKKIAELGKKLKVLKDAGDKDAAWTESELKRMKLLRTKIDKDEDYKLGGYELDQYGLVKSVENSNPDLYKSLEFEIIGQRIKDAMIGKIAELKGKLGAMIEKLKSGQTANVNTVEDDVMSDNAQPVPKTIRNPEDVWEVKSLKRDIERFERQVRNIDVKKKFKLGAYELDEYGL